MSNSEMGRWDSDRPYDWFNLKQVDNPATLHQYWENIRVNGVGTGEHQKVFGCISCSTDQLNSTTPPSVLFVVMTGDQYEPLNGAP